MEQNTREICRLTVASALAERRLEAEVAADNAWLQSQDRKRRAFEAEQNRLDRIFEAINRDNRKRPETIRAETAVEAAWTACPEEAAETRYLQALETGWRWFFMALILAGMGLVLHLNLQMGVLG